LVEDDDEELVGLSRANLDRKPDGMSCELVVERERAGKKEGKRESKGKTIPRLKVFQRKLTANANTLTSRCHPDPH
jgi:hypothetical protein